LLWDDQVLASREGVARARPADGAGGVEPLRAGRQPHARPECAEPPGAAGAPPGAVVGGVWWRFERPKTRPEAAERLRRVRRFAPRLSSGFAQKSGARPCAGVRWVELRIAGRFHTVSGVWERAGAGACKSDRFERALRQMSVDAEGIKACSWWFERSDTPAPRGLRSHPGRGESTNGALACLPGCILGL
jgi:hypothetical protein